MLRHLFLGPLVTGKQIGDGTLVPCVPVRRHVDGAAGGHVDEVVSRFRHQQAGEQSLAGDGPKHTDCLSLLQANKMIAQNYYMGSF